MPCWISDNLFPSYLENLRDRYLDKGLPPTEKLHVCRNHDCAYRGICVQDDREYIVCDNCEGTTCVRCDTPWLPDHSCDEQRPITPTQTGEAETQRYLDERCFPCPGCGRHIEKVGGCDHITCELRSVANRYDVLICLTGSKCGHEFGWTCHGSSHMERYPKHM